MVDVTVASHAALRSDVIMTATFFDSTRAKIATATGGDVFLDPGTTRTITLTGQRPDRSITAVTIDVVTHPSVAASAAP